MLVTPKKSRMLYYCSMYYQDANWDSPLSPIYFIILIEVCLCIYLCLKFPKNSDRKSRNGTGPGTRACWDCAMCLLLVSLNFLLNFVLLSRLEETFLINTTLKYFYIFFCILADGKQAEQSCRTYLTGNLFKQ